VRLQTVLIALILLLSGKSPALQVFDSHVHLWEGEKSLREYEAQAKTAGIDLVGLAGMWFGGPNLALSGHPEEIRASNDAHFALAKKHPEMLPIATVHPYDGQAAMERSRASPSLVSKFSSCIRTRRSSTPRIHACWPSSLVLVIRA
jgi:uncharacterized protein